MKSLNIIYLIGLALIIVVVIILMKKKNNNLKSFKTFKTFKPWTQEEINDVYNLLNDPTKSDFAGCDDFINCYVNELSKISSYDYLMTHMTITSKDTDPILIDFFQKIDKAQAKCLSSFECNGFFPQPTLKRSGNKSLLRK